MTDMLSKVPEEEIVLMNNEEEDDEETRDFYIYILSREHPTVLTPVPNPYKRSDRIKEANAELMAESPTPSSARLGARIRFNDTPMLYEYIKQEDVLSLSNGDPSLYEHDSSPSNQGPTNDVKNDKTSNRQTATKIRQIDDWTEELEAENQDKEYQSINKENIQPLEEGDTKHEKISKENNNEKIMKTVRKASNKIVEDSVQLTSECEVNQSTTATKISTENQELPDFKECLTLNEVHKHDMPESRDESYTEALTIIEENNINKCDVKTDKMTKNQDIEYILETNEQGLNNYTEKGIVSEKLLPRNGVEINPIVNNIENKLNYRPISTERIGIGLNKTPKVVTSSNGSKLKTSASDKEEKIKTDLSKNNKTIGSTKKNVSVHKSKAIISKQETVTEMTKKNKSPIVKTSKNDVKSPGKESSQRSKDFESKNSARVKPTQRNPTEQRDTEDYEKENTGDETQELPLGKPKAVVSSEIKTSNVNSTKLLSSEEVKSKLEEIKEQNRSKLVVLVPPFEQYKSYMNDNYSDSDDNESFDIEEFLRKEDQANDLPPYLPDFELESDNELDELCKENASLAELSNLYPESICTKLSKGKLHGSLRKKATSGGGKRMTRSLEDDELRSHQCKMMDNVKCSQQYENSVKKFSQENGGGSSSVVKCKQKCLQRPSTAPGGRKFGCDCKWPRIKLPEYNGLRSEYGLSAEQLCERKRQRQEITKRIRERRQRKVDEEERRKMENERMFHEWLLKKRAQAKEQWLRNQRLRSMRYSRQCITPNQTKPKSAQSKSNTPLAIRKKLHPGRNCFSLDEIINDVTERNDENKTYKIYLGLSIE